MKDFYFCAMRRISGVVFFVVMVFPAVGQIRHGKLVLKAKEVFEIKDSDILVVDTLVMHDSSQLILNKLKEENFIHAKAAIFYRGAKIDGKGVAGLKGRKGRPGLSPSSPCTNGGDGQRGTDGTNGGRGTKLSFYFNSIQVPGSLIIDVSGGDAGDGGPGGDGGGGGPGTRICQGGNGGRGSLGGNGGVGGNAGDVTFHSPVILQIRSDLGGKIVVRNYGGNLGLAADGGSGGFAGLSSVGNNKMDGRPGKKGGKGKDGLQGKTGSINFELK